MSSEYETMMGELRRAGHTVAAAAGLAAARKALRVATPTAKHKIPDALIDAVAKTLVDHVRQKLGPLEQRIKELEQRIKELEQRPSLFEAGTWQDGQTYDPGAVTTFGGGAWVARQTTTQRPGTDATWRLFVKSGRRDKRT